jgi:hypothetical protein
VPVRMFRPGPNGTLTLSTSAKFCTASTNPHARNSHPLHYCAGLHSGG